MRSIKKSPPRDSNSDNMIPQLSNQKKLHTAEKQQPVVKVTAGGSSSGKKRAAVDRSRSKETVQSDCQVHS